MSFRQIFFMIFFFHWGLVISFLCNVNMFFPHDVFSFWSNNGDLYALSRTHWSSLKERGNILWDTRMIVTKIVGCVFDFVVNEIWLIFLQEVHRASEAIRYRHPLRKYLEVIIKKVNWILLAHFAKAYSSLTLKLPEAIIIWKTR